MPHPPNFRLHPHPSTLQNAFPLDFCLVSFVYLHSAFSVDCIARSGFAKRAKAGKSGEKAMENRDLVGENAISHRLATGCTNVWPSAKKNCVHKNGLPVQGCPRHITYTYVYVMQLPSVMESHKNDLWQWERVGNGARGVNQGQNSLTRL